ncbi:MAG: preprotein translocase subunit YajC [Oscillospiraceae bacterium]|nr:preprotein translocase subunit YajC [Oscillospiraceae bacterium]
MRKILAIALCVVFAGAALVACAGTEGLFSAPPNSAATPNISNNDADNQQSDGDAGLAEEADSFQTVSFFENYSMVLMILLLVIIFYVFMIRPERKHKKKLAEMRSSISVGDEIVTIEGIIGTVVAVDGESVIMDTSEDKARLHITKWAIGSSSSKIPEKKKKKNIFVIAGVSTAAIALVFLVVFLIVIPLNSYNQALVYFNDEQYEEALACLEELSLEYRDVNDLRTYFSAYVTFEQGEYELAAKQFDELNGFRYSDKMKNESNYLYANELLNGEKYDEAFVLFEHLSEYKDSAELMPETRYRQAVAIMESDSTRAREIFEELGDYKDSALLLMEIEG